jgi:hypothetical protein
LFTNNLYRFPLYICLCGFTALTLLQVLLLLSTTVPSNAPLPLFNSNRFFRLSFDE